LIGHLNQDFTPQRQFIAYFFLANSFCLICSALIALGSEYGWRGFLLTELFPLGKRKASILSGLLWGIWFIPLVLLRDYSTGRSLFWEPWTGEPSWHVAINNYYYNNIIIGISMKIIFSVLLGIIISWIYFTSKNIFLCCFSFAVFEQMSPLGYVIIRNVDPFIGGPEGIAGIIVLFVIVLIIWFFIGWNRTS
jgi:hypothetical protein